MELVYLGIALLLLITLDVLSIRFGADSRNMSADKREW
jgi:hypothetical protein